VAVEEIRFTKELEDVKLDKVGVDVCLECELSKEGQKVEWFKDSKKIRPDVEHDIQVEGRMHRLIIKKATPKDIGTYRADYMHLSTAAKVSIEGRPLPSRLVGHTRNLATGVSRLPVLDCGMTFHPGFGGRDSPSILSDDL